MVLVGNKADVDESKFVDFFFFFFLLTFFFFLLSKLFLHFFSLFLFRFQAKDEVAEKKAISLNCPWIEVFFFFFYFSLLSNPFSCSSSFPLGFRFRRKKMKILGNVFFF